MHKVFVYGSLKKGFGNHPLLQGSAFLGNTTTRDSHYVMGSFGAFPAVRRGGHLKVAGELYEVDSETLGRLDNLEGNGSFYKREKVPLDNGKWGWIYLLCYSVPDSDHGIKIQDGVLIWEKTSWKVNYFSAKKEPSPEINFEEDPETLFAFEELDKPWE